MTLSFLLLRIHNINLWVYFNFFIKFLSHCEIVIRLIINSFQTILDKKENIIH